MDAFAGGNGLRYDLIDMNLNGGLGDIVSGQKNVVLLNPASEQIVPVVAANGNDIWIVTHPWNSSSFNVYPITCSGLSNIPLVSTIGSYRGGSNTDAATGSITILCLKPPIPKKAGTDFFATLPNRWEYMFTMRITSTTANKK